MIQAPAPARPARRRPPVPFVDVPPTTPLDAPDGRGFVDCRGEWQSLGVEEQ